MSFSHLPYLSFLLVFIFLRSPPVLATRFSVRTDVPTDNITEAFGDPDDFKPSYFNLASPSDQVFGLSSEGNLTISLSFSTSLTNVACPARLALCQASNTFVRGPNYRRRQSQPPFRNVTNDVAITACSTSDPSPFERIPAKSTKSTNIAWCVTESLCQGNNSAAFSVPQNKLDPNTMYLLAAALCNLELKPDVLTKNDFTFSLDGQAHFLNPDLIFPELGFEEVLFPIFAAVVIALLSVIFISLLIALVVFFGRRVPFRHVVQYVLAAVVFKLLVAIITFVHFFAIAQSGFQQSWFMYARLLVAFCADTLFIIALICVACGLGVMPSSWFVQGRSPIFSVYVAVVLQLLIIIAVKVMFPFQYLGKLYRLF